MLSCITLLSAAWLFQSALLVHGRNRDVDPRETEAVTPRTAENLAAIFGGFTSRRNEYGMSCRYFLGVGLGDAEHLVALSTGATRDQGER